MEHQYTIEACFRIHNLIVDHREEMKNQEIGIEEVINDEDDLNVHYESHRFNNPFMDFGVVCDSTRAPGRPRADEKFERDRGVALRDMLAQRIRNNGISRPE